MAGEIQLPSLEGKVVMDYSDFEKFLKTVDKTVDEADSKMRKLGDSFTSAGTKMTAMASLPVAAGMAFSIKAASDLGEAQNVTNITFGEGAKEIDAFVKTAAQGLGQSERAAREATASFGGLLDNMGFTNAETVKWSKSLTTLASDLGSAFNKEPAEAALALGSALRGETEPIRAFNVMLDDAAIRTKAVELGLAETTAEVDKHGKAQGALALIMEQTSRYQGDFANTADGLANKSRTARAQLEDTAASLGAHLLPVAADAAAEVNDLAVSFAGLTETQQKTVIGIGTFLVALGPSLVAIGKTMQAVDALTAAMARHNMTAAGMAKVSAAGLVVGALGIAYVQTRAEVERFMATVEQDINTSSINTLREAHDKTVDELNRHVAEQRTFMGVVKLSGIQARILGGEVKDLRAEYETANQVLDNTAEALGITRGEAELLAFSTGTDLTKGVHSAKEELIDAYVAMRTGDQHTNKLAKSTDELTSSVADAEERYDAFQDTLEIVFGGLLGAEQASLRLKEETLELVEAYNEAAGKATLNTEKGRALTDQLINGTIPAVLAEVEALTADGRISGEAAAQKQAIVERLQALQKEFPALRPRLQEYIDKVHEIPDTALTTAEIDTAEATRKIDALIRKLNSIPLKEGQVQTPVLGGSVEARASGGPVNAGHLYRVGEEGPEIVRMAGNGNVYSAQQTAAMLSGGGDTNVSIELNIHGVSDASGFHDVLPEVTQAIRAGVGAN